MREITYVEALREALKQSMEKDPNVILIGEDIGVYGGSFGVTAGLIDLFGKERVRDTPDSEAALIGACVGAAMSGLRPVGEIMFSDFVVDAMDQITMQAAKTRYMFGAQVTIPTVIRLPGGSGTGAAAQHSECLENWFVHMPGLKVVVPSNPYDAKGLLMSSIQENNPIMFFEHKLLYRTKGDVPEKAYTIPLGKSKIVREGTHITVVAISIMVSKALDAADILAKEGIEIEIIDPRTLKPLDDAPIFESVVKTGKVLIVHEAVKNSGFGAEIAARIADSQAFYYLDGPIKRLGGMDIPIPYNRYLERMVVPQVEDIVNEARKLARNEF
jgi:pyruvate/2-oxoglutarate/acetoin dehydrogenase E1 component